MSPARSALLAIAVCSVCAASAPALAEKVYQWTDADGVTHYADAPPATGTYRDRDLEAPAPAQAPASTAAPAVPSATADQCEQARRNLANLSSGDDVGFDRDGDGAMDAAMTPAQREEQLAVARAAIDRHCGGPEG